MEVHNFGDPISFNEYVDKMTWKPQPTTQQILKEQETFINLFNNNGMKKVEF